MAATRNARDIFLNALDRAPADRAAYLDEACGDDAALRQRVEALLRADDEPGAFLSEARPGMSDAATGTCPPPADSAGLTASFPGKDEHVGAILGGKYKLIEAIGEGGMGSVFMAQQTAPVKRAVAVKVIKAGMDSKAVLARFEAERQALAMMDHPNIARVLDAGTTEGGRPFFVMELVKGVPITRYCDERRLTPQQRLELFVPVCLAIQHAHQKGIIHRDIKPSNVLVALYDDKPVPKVIDFGVAKAAGQALTDKTLMTGFGAVVGTPEYMSPEQASLNNLDIDTRSDVYSLGVLLFELLTGSTPVDRKSLGKAALLEILRIVREVEVPKPSHKLSTSDALPSVAARRGTESARLTKMMKGELDWVVLKALEKDRTRRYDTANGLARDLQRYLADEMVEARPPSVGYRLSKFMRRHKGPVIAASLVLLALVAGIVGTTLGLFEAWHQEKIARGETAEKEKARQAAALRVEERDEALTQKALRVKERDRANDELTHRLGVSTMVLANDAYDIRDFRLSAERLAKVPVQQRGWEWRHLQRQLHGGIFTLYGHKSAVTSVAFSPDGTRIVTADANHLEPAEVKVWDARTGMYLFDLKGLPSKQINGVRYGVNVVFSADSKRIVTATWDETARVYDATTGALQLELKQRAGAEGIVCAAFSPDGTQIATGSRCWADNGGLLKLLDARTGKTLREWQADKFAVTRVAFSPDGARILTGGFDQAVKVWDARTGTLLLEAKGMMSLWSSVAFSPDGTRLVAGRDDRTARVIDAQTGAVLLELKGRQPISHSNRSGGGPEGVLSVAFSPDGTRIATAGGTGGFGNDEGGASVWDVRTGAELLELKGHTGMVMSVAFSPDGERIITGSADGTAKVWDARTGTPRLELEGIKNPIECAAFSPDGSWIVTGGGEWPMPGEVQKPSEATIWDARTGKPRLALKGCQFPVSSVAVSKDGTRIVIGGGWRWGQQKPSEAMVWDAQTGQALFELKGSRLAVTSVAISPNGERILTGGGFLVPQEGSEARVWDARTGTLLRNLTQPHHQRMDMQGARVSVAFSPDGKRVVVAGARTTTMHEGVTIYDAQTGATLLEMGNNDSPRSVAFSPDGARIATGNYNKTVTVWDARKGNLLFERKGFQRIPFRLSLSADGRLIATGGYDKTVTVWDVTTGTQLAELETGPVKSLAFAVDGTRIVTEQDQITKLWDVKTGKELQGEPIPETVPSERISADGRFFAHLSQDRAAVVPLVADENELAYRRLHTQPKLSRYRAGYLAARKAKDDFAAAFYLNLIPPDERQALLAQAEVDALRALSRLVDAHVSARKLEEAVPVQIEILNINKAKLGPEDPNTIQAAETLGLIYLEMAQCEKAIPLLEDVVKYQKANPGWMYHMTPDLSQVLFVFDAREALAMAYEDAGRLPEAIAVLEAANSPFYERHLLEAYELAGEHAKVVALCVKSLAAARESKPNNHPGVAAQQLVNLANILARLGRANLGLKQWPEAEAHLREYVDLQEKNWPDAWTTFDAQSMLGASLLGQKRYTEAERLLLEGYDLHSA
jgi:WD40 repeat protein/serine/threonine protein kinase